MNPLRWSFRAVHLCGFVICAALIGYALYAQYALGMDPCPLCILQRVGFMVLGLLFLIAGMHAPRRGWRWLYVGLIVLVALAGAGVALRHLWIQSLPPGEVPSCGAPLGYMLETRAGNGGLIGVLLKVLNGSGECAKVQDVLGVPMPAWSLLWFLLLGAWSVCAALRWRSAALRRTT